MNSRMTFLVALVWAIVVVVTVHFVGVCLDTPASSTKLTWISSSQRDGWRLRKIPTPAD